MEKIVADHTVIQVTSPSEGNYFVHFQAPTELPEILPGHFAEIQVPDAPEVFLRRPFSILDVDYVEQTISFYVKVIGKGTKRLSELLPGQQVNLIYPLGNTFTIPDNTERALIVAGGSGIAPFILLGRELNDKNIPVTFLLGGRSAKDILLQEEFSQLGTVEITTEDGSLGEQGMVTQHSLFRTDPFDYDIIYTCGPDPMMHAVSRLAKEKRTPCEASLENMMACGFGVCLCCVTPTTEGNKRVCIEGPVFDTKKLKWQI